MDFSTAYQRRKRHGEFAERWEGALRERALRQAQGEREGEQALTLPPPPAAPSLSPEGRVELVTRPDGKVIKGSDARWGKRAEERFLAELTMSANVKRAAAAAGFSTAAVYKRRLKDRHLAAAWDAAIETGKARVQAFLVEAATRTFDPDELPVGGDDEPMKVSISEAINIAKLSPSTGSGRAGKGTVYYTDDDEFDGRPVTRDEWEEAGRNIVDRLNRLREQMEEQEQETGRCHSCGQVLPVAAEA